jgi:hypothetical protein
LFISHLSNQFIANALKANIYHRKRLTNHERQVGRGGASASAATVVNVASTGTVGGAGSTGFAESTTI